MKALVSFVAGAAVAAVTVWYVVEKRRPAEPAAVTEPAVVQAPAPVEAPPPAVEEPAPNPPPAPPVERKPQPKPAAKRVVTPPPPPTQAEPAKPVAERPPPPPLVETAAPPPESKPAKPVPEPPPPPREPNRVTLAAGTLITVRLAEALSSDKNTPGDAFAATLDSPVVAEGFVLAERGARLEGRVVEAEKAGRLKGVAHLGVQLVRFTTSDGQKVEIQTDTFAKEGPATVKEDAAKVGVAAGIGAAVGAIAGGGKGAAIGAAVGGAAGAGGVAATRGKAAELDVETRISFRLSAPVTVTEKLR